ncbi:MAG TPA: TIM-barrel domain-containing protein [Ktedonobacterales bacterium]
MDQSDQTSEDGGDGPPIYRPLGSVRRVDDDASDTAWHFAAEDGTRVEVAVLAEAVVRVRLLPPEREPAHSWFVASTASWPVVPVAVAETDGGLRLTTADCEVDIRTGDTSQPESAPFRVAFAWPARDGQPPVTFGADDDHLGMGIEGDTLRCAKRLEPGEHIYGAGERTGPLDRRGQRITFWNIDPTGRHSDATRAMYVSIPFWLSVRAGRAYGILMDSAARGELDVGAARSDCLTFATAGADLTYYVLAGPTPTDVLRQYADLTGNMPLPPRWALGYQQSRWSYYPAEHLRAIAAEFRARRIPCDALYLDIDYMDGWRDFTWSPTRYPDPAGLLGELAADGFKVVTIIDPGIRRDPTDPTFTEGLARDAFCRWPDGTLFTGKVWPGECVFPDFSQASVRAWWGERHRALVEAGVAGIWTDMNEPALTAPAAPGEAVTHITAMDASVVHRAGGEDGPPLAHGAFHNAYGLQMARATHEALARLRPGERSFILSRSGSAGIQRHAAVWTGDNSSEWAHLRLALRMCLGLGLSGVPFVGADVGGFWGDCTGEMLVRFTQLGAVLPFMRNHSAWGMHPQEPWAFGQPYEAMCRAAIELRYRLLPYFYAAFDLAAINGEPIAAPLIFTDPGDETAATLDDELLLGHDLLVAPVLDKDAASRAVYFPGAYDTWVDWTTGQRFAGRSRVDYPAPLDVLPLFAREGAIIPLGPVLQYVGEQPADPITLACFLGGDGSLATGTLYEDDGHTTDHERGAWRRTSFAARREGTRITLEASLVPRTEIMGSGEPAEVYDPDTHAWVVELHLAHAAPQRQVAVRAVAVDGVDLSPNPSPARGGEPDTPNWSVVPRRYESVVRVAVLSAALPFTLVVEMDEA